MTSQGRVASRGLLMLAVGLLSLAVLMSLSVRRGNCAARQPREAKCSVKARVPPKELSFHKNDLQRDFHSPKLPVTE